MSSSIKRNSGGRPRPTQPRPSLDCSVDATVIVAAFEQPTVALAIDCLVNQKTTLSYEIIVCDDGSMPSLFAACHESLARTRIPVYWVWQADRGYRLAASRNNALRLARGRHLILLDGDMIPEEDLVTKHVEALWEPRTIVAGNRLWRSLQPVLQIGPIGPDELWPMLRGDAAQNEQDRRCESGERRVRTDLLESDANWRACWTCNMSVARSPEVYFDEFYEGWGMEDADLAFRLSVEGGYSVTYRGDIVAYHLSSTRRIPTQTGEHDDIVKFLRNCFYFYNKSPNVSLQDAFCLLPRFELDERHNKWGVRVQESPEDLAVLVESARQWLLENDFSHPQVRRSVAEDN
jgi:cellulose synthase/poly-beta-1,6-N-acetylglucosamine synthase-like glycosyltransferase